MIPLVFVVEGPAYKGSAVTFYTAVDKLVKAIVDGAGAGWQDGEFGTCHAFFADDRPALSLTHLCRGVWNPIRIAETVAYDWASQAHTAKFTQGYVSAPVGPDPKKALAKLKADARRDLRQAMGDEFYARGIPLF